MLLLERAHGHTDSAETLPASIFKRFYNTKSMLFSKTFMFLKKLMCGDAAEQYFPSCVQHKINSTLKSPYVFEEIDGRIRKPICFIAIIVSETPRGPLERPELRELPKLLPATTSQAQVNTVWGLAQVSYEFSL